jgi:membrane protein
MERVSRLRRRWAEAQLPVYAANGAFFLVLSLFPILSLLLGLIGRLSLSRTEFFSVFSQLVPAAVRPLFLEAIRTAGRGAALSVSALAGLWSASRGVYSLLQGLRRISTAPGSCGGLMLRLLSVVYTAVFLLALLVTFALHNLGHGLLGLLHNSELAASLYFVLHRRGGICFAFLSGLFALVYRAFPPGSGHRLRQVLPGSLLAAGGWVLFSALFSWWSGAASDASRVYGSVAGMALAMLWLYFCLLIVLFGALLNETP